MATEAHTAPHAAPTRPATGAWSWVTTVDHKRIGILYLYTTFFFFAVGGLMALAIRLQLEHANNQVVSAESYDRLFTMHGTTMIFLFVVPVMAAFGNYLVPLQIGARMLWMVQMKLIAPISDEMPRMCRPTIHRSRPCPGESTESGGYAVQPASAAPPPHRKLEYITRPPNSSSQNEAAFRRGKAMSRAPIWSGTR